MRKALVLGLIATIIPLLASNELNEEFSRASYYNAHNPGSSSCGKVVTFSATAGVKLWDSGKACGRRYHVKCVNGGPTEVPCKSDKEILVTIQRNCTNICDDSHHMDLSTEAFANIARIDKTQVIDIAYRPEI